MHVLNNLVLVNKDYHICPFELSAREMHDLLMSNNFNDFVLNLEIMFSQRTYERHRLCSKRTVDRQKEVQILDRFI
jgi:hypothetical protein